MENFNKSFMLKKRIDDELRRREEKMFIPILIKVGYKRLQMVNFENHQFDVQNEWVNLYEDIELIAKKINLNIN